MVYLREKKALNWIRRRSRRFLSVSHECWRVYGLYTVTQADLCCWYAQCVWATPEGRYHVAACLHLVNSTSRLGLASVGAMIDVGVHRTLAWNHGCIVNNSLLSHWSSQLYQDICFVNCNGTVRRPSQPTAGPYWKFLVTIHWTSPRDNNITTITWPSMSWLTVYLTVYLTPISIS